MQIVYCVFRWGDYEFCCWVFEFWEGRRHFDCLNYASMHNYLTSMPLSLSMKIDTRCSPDFSAQ